MYRLLAALLLPMFLVAGCAAPSKKKVEEENVNAGGGDGKTEYPVGDENLLGDSDSGKAFGLQTVYFDFDSFLLTESSKAALAANANVLKEKKAVKIQVEGHCDARGGIQYNIALGEKRANAVKKYLEDMGIGADRITTISYGKERLLDSRDTEEAHAKNRRANFVITSK